MSFTNSLLCQVECLLLLCREIEALTEILERLAEGKVRLLNTYISAVIQFHHSLPPLFLHTFARESTLSSNEKVCNTL